MGSSLAAIRVLKWERDLYLLEFDCSGPNAAFWNTVFSVHVFWSLIMYWKFSIFSRTIDGLCHDFSSHYILLLTLLTLDKHCQKMCATHCQDHFYYVPKEITSTCVLYCLSCCLKNFKWISLKRINCFCFLLLFSVFYATNSFSTTF